MSDVVPLVKDLGAGQGQIRPLKSGDAIVAEDGGGALPSGISPLDNDLSPANTSGDQSPTGITLSATPAGYAQVFINGKRETVSGSTTGASCYFSADGGTTARLLGQAQAGDQLIWNALVAGYELLNSADLVSIDYLV